MDDNDSPPEHGYTVEVPEGYDEAVIRTRMALRGEGFSVLSEMHVGGMLGPQMGDARQYLFMGVYNGIVRQRRLDEELQVAVHLPCNVVVHETGTTAVVAALDPAEDAEGADPEAQAAAGSARDALLRLLTRIGATP